MRHRLRLEQPAAILAAALAHSRLPLLTPRSTRELWRPLRRSRLPHECQSSAALVCQI